MWDCRSFVGAYINESWFVSLNCTFPVHSASVSAQDWPLELLLSLSHPKNHGLMRLSIVLQFGSQLRKRYQVEKGGEGGSGETSPVHVATTAQQTVLATGTSRLQSSVPASIWTARSVWAKEEGDPWLGLSSRHVPSPSSHNTHTSPPPPQLMCFTWHRRS